MSSAIATQHPALPRQKQTSDSLPNSWTNARFGENTDTLARGTRAEERAKPACPSQRTSKNKTPRRNTRATAAERAVHRCRGTAPAWRHAGRLEGGSPERCLPARLQLSKPTTRHPTNSDAPQIRHSCHDSTRAARPVACADCSPLGRTGSSVLWCSNLIR